MVLFFVLWVTGAYGGDLSAAGLEDLDLFSAESDGWKVYAELGVAIGRISNGFSDDAQMDQFGEPLRHANEQDGIGIRAGFGRSMGIFQASVYGGAAYLGSGALMDNHGPFIPAELRYSLGEFCYGVELRAWLFNFRIGRGSYSGSVELHAADSTESASRDAAWETRLEDGRGMHLAAGIGCPPGLPVYFNIEYCVRYIRHRLGETPTGAEPTEARPRMSEVRLAVGWNLPVD
jgi:hypothetical protein